MSQDTLLAGLAPHVRANALALKQEFGDVIQLLSGYRDLTGQAHAMATQVIQNRHWIEQTYRRMGRPSYDVGKHLQAWVNAHPEITTIEDLATGLLTQLEQDPYGNLISLHCVTIKGEPASRAFDLVPLEQGGTFTEVGARVWERILALPYLDPPPLRREGGKVIWHAQFTGV